MRNAVWSMLALALVHCASRPSGTQRSANDRANVVAFVGVTVVPCDRDRVIEDQTVVVRDGRIVALGPSATLPVPASAARIDGRGKFLMPGLAEMHGHLPDANFPEQMLQLPLFVANGVTTVRGMAGAPNHVMLREQISRGEVLGPRLVVYGPAMNGRSSPTPAIEKDEIDSMLADVARRARTAVKDVVIDEKEMLRLRGTYDVSKLGVQINVERRNGTLVLMVRDAHGTQTFRLRSQGDGSFRIPEIAAKVTFDFQDGRVVAMVLAKRGDEIRAERRR